MIRIGREIQCVPYAGFLFQCFAFIDFFKHMVLLFLYSVQPHPLISLSVASSLSTELLTYKKNQLVTF